ncbi:hypothetical protein DUNSADRAFT_3996 [Dunaliella salina]|uniref:Uncharacterized protein n=1 Tax=Dunaliella salina TaxID=3046 RepID=A0ABQ7FV22_DUNSA|nr:hypothetical protein DUNSADRAFT_3996 [Dunaliella salina]|eukprot:KAF5826244.1 hypothetical protein DUNSADRAFT_3996 [Dunaliella salina]
MCITSNSSVANTGRKRRPNRIWTRIMQPWRQQAVYLDRTSARNQQRALESAIKRSTERDKKC